MRLFPSLPGACLDEGAGMIMGLTRNGGGFAALSAMVSVG